MEAVSVRLDAAAPAASASATVSSSAAAARQRAAAMLALHVLYSETKSPNEMPTCACGRLQWPVRAAVRRCREPMQALQPLRRASQAAKQQQQQRVRAPASVPAGVTSNALAGRQSRGERGRRRWQPAAGCARACHVASLPQRISIR